MSEENGNVVMNGGKSMQLSSGSFENDGYKQGDMANDESHAERGEFGQVRERVDGRGRARSSSYADRDEAETRPISSGKRSSHDEEQDEDLELDELDSNDLLKPTSGSENIRTKHHQPSPDYADHDTDPMLFASSNHEPTAPTHTKPRTQTRTQICLTK